MNRIQMKISTLRLIKAVAASLLGLFLAACKIEVVVPEGGRVVTQSGSFSCASGRNCSIEVVDVYFEETFDVVPASGYAFMGWRAGPGHFCGGELVACSLSTRGVAGRERLEKILYSDRVFTLAPVFKKIPAIREADITSQGDVYSTEQGYELDGLLSLAGKGGIKHDFTQARLDLEFESDGRLLNLSGATHIPEQLTDNIAVLGKSRAEVGLYTGAEINADPAFEITLREERQYLAFLMSAGVDLELRDDEENGGSTLLSISTPASGKAIMILDPADQMLFRYGDVSGTAYGEAESDQGLLPFIPMVEQAGLKRFDGHKLKTGTIPVGIKAVDLLSLSGQHIIRQRKYSLVDLSDPFNAPVDYKAGFNGEAAFSFAVFGFGLFEFDLAEASGMFAVSRKQQSLSLYSKIEPDLEWMPSWSPVQPTGKIESRFSFNGEGELQASLEGSYGSSLPSAEIQGSVRIDNDSVTLRGEVSDGLTVPVSMTFRQGEVHARVHLDADFSSQIESSVDDAFGRVESDVANAMQMLENAVGDYELELSLNGLRRDIPHISDTVVSVLQRVPSTVYSTVQREVKKGIDANNVCVIICAVSKSRRDKEARNAATSARDQATRYLAPHIARMKELKRLAGTADDETVRAALRVALRTIYDNRRIKKTINVTVKVAGFKVKRSHTINEPVLTAEQASRVLLALENIDRIPAANGYKLRMQKIVDSLPTEDALRRARDQVDQGVKAVPGVSEVGYSVVRGHYAPYVKLSDGRRFDLEFNVLDPLVAIEGIGELLVTILVD